MRRTQVVANEHIKREDIFLHMLHLLQTDSRETAVRVISEVQQDDDGISDAGTEKQAYYMPTSEDPDYPQAGSSTPSRQQTTTDMRLRTRTILLELANELESARQQMDSMQADKQRVVSSSGLPSEKKAI